MTLLVPGIINPPSASDFFLKTVQLCNTLSVYLWKPKIHYRVNKSSSLGPVLKQYVFYIIPVYSFKIHFNITFPSTSYKIYFSFGSFNQTFVGMFYTLNACYMSYPSHPHPPSVHHLNNVWWRVQTMDMNSVLPMTFITCLTSYGIWRRVGFKIGVGNDVSETPITSVLRKKETEGTRSRFLRNSGTYLWNDTASHTERL